MKRIINGFEVDWASERVFAEQQKHRTMDICSRSPIARCVYVSTIGGASDNPDGDAERLEKDARRAEDHL